MTELEELLDARLDDVRNCYLIEAAHEENPPAVLITFGDSSLVILPVVGDDVLMLEARCFYRHASVGEMQIIRLPR